MTLRILLSLVALVGASVWLTDRVGAQEYGGSKEGQTPKVDEEQAKMMEAWMKLAVPGEHHEHLKPFAGNWNNVVKWRYSPDAPWEETRGKSEAEWILGGRFLRQQTEGESMMEGSPPFEGFGIIGYDNLKKKYISVWMDNMGTMILIAEGTCNASGKVITFKGEYNDAMSGGKKKSKSVYRVINDNKYVIEMFDYGPDGREFKNLEVVFTRS